VPRVIDECNHDRIDADSWRRRERRRLNHGIGRRRLLRSTATGGNQQAP
jgi:hypothetical protein